MKIKLDENIPAGLVDSLRQLGHEVDTVPQEKLTGSNDQRVWKEVQKEHRFFITQDLDFSDIRRYEPGRHDGLLLLRLKEPGRKALVERILTLFKTCDVNQWQGCFVVATENKLRIRSGKATN